MPTYEYRCPVCGFEFEKFQRMSEPPIAECAQCGGTAERRLSGGAGLLFKGSGFYITDYRSAGYKKSAEAEKGGTGEKAGGAKGGESSGSSKPPAKGE